MNFSVQSTSSNIWLQCNIPSLSDILKWIVARVWQFYFRMTAHLCCRRKSYEERREAKAKLATFQWVPLPCLSGRKLLAFKWRDTVENYTNVPTLLKISCKIQYIAKIWFKFSLFNENPYWNFYPIIIVLLQKEILFLIITVLDISVSIIWYCLN